MMRKKDAAICLCMISLDPVNELPPPAHGLGFRRRLLWEGSEWKIYQNAKNGQNYIRKDTWHSYHKN
jgi:hypothetical protein